ncbi:MarR family transcriptional regulator [Phytomonospora sp. NPDC050363]|uniref:MarR family winged helix-turn-helix transcriptional regulator n=1 Tax=Phytomonospora sp. NPDC050363 TaxID=3155642 RepID=UPI00340879EE
MDETLRLRNQVCFALHSASRAVTGVYRPILDELGLTYPQFLVLLALWERDGRTVSELGAALRLDSGTLSPLLKRLESAGMVDRRRDTADERQVTVHLTDDGEALRERARAVPGQVAAASGLTREELVELRDVLTTLTDNLKGES